MDRNKESTHEERMQNAFVTTCIGNSSWNNSLAGDGMRLRCGTTIQHKLQYFPAFALSTFLVAMRWPPDPNANLATATTELADSMLMTKAWYEIDRTGRSSDPDYCQGAIDM